MGFTGWYKDPTLVKLFFLVIPIEIAVLVIGLRKTAPGQGYGSPIVTFRRLRVREPASVTAVAFRT
jgi:hypothetical protein